MSPLSTSTGSAGEVFSYSLPADLRAAVARASQDWDKADGTARLWAKDASLWTNSDEGQWLGWLDVVDRQLQDLSKFKALSAEVREDGFSHLLLLAVGGAGLSPALLRHLSKKQSGCLEMTVLSTTEPSEVRRVRSNLDPARTLFCVSAGSGRSIETASLAGYFFEEATKAVGQDAALHFISIGGPNTPPADFSGTARYRHIYTGDANAEAAYGAFSDFSLVPVAAAGQDVEKLLRGAKEMARLSQSSDSLENPGIALGLLLGTAASEFRRDKVTLICSSSVHPLGPWIGQLLAVSTGQRLIPVSGEPLLEWESYGADRVFVYVRRAHDQDRTLEKHISELEGAGHPVLRLVFEDTVDLGRLMFQWQIASAVASAFLRVNPFRFAGTDRVELVPHDNAPTPLLTQGAISLYAAAGGTALIMRRGDTAGAVIRRHLDRLTAGDHFALLAYLPEFPEYIEVLQKMRKGVLECKQSATVLGFGSSFLHSAGAACIDGPNSSVLLQITCDEGEDLAVPGKDYTFGEVTAARARGDFNSLAQGNRRILRVHLGLDLARGLNQLHDLVCAAVEH